MSRTDRDAIEAFRTIEQAIRSADVGGELDLPAAAAQVSVNGKVKVIGPEGARVAIIYNFFGRGENFIGYLWDVDGGLPSMFDAVSYPGYTFVTIDGRIAYIDADLGDGFFAVSRMED
jgi:hypothetical protein